MYSFSIDYLFNRVYDVLLWVKFVTLFKVGGKDEGVYLKEKEGTEYDGLRDRGWFDAYTKEQEALKNNPNTDNGFIENTVDKLGIKLKDSDGDGKANIFDSSNNDPNNLTKAELRERFEIDYGTGDKIRSLFGVSPKDSDEDGVPNSYELKHNMNPNEPNTDHDGLLDGQELVKGTNPLSNDTDHDGVLDGRDEAPNDYSISSIGQDSDGDGVSDRVENFLGMNIGNKDSDNDGIPDGMDTYPTDATNFGIKETNINVGKYTDGLHFSIQNPVLGYISQALSLFTVFLLFALAYVILRWFIVFVSALRNYEEHFMHGTHSHNSNHDDKVEHNSLGIDGLAIKDETENSSIDENARWNVVKGYMESDTEELWRIGIIEADNMLREVLESKGYNGADVGEKLSNAKFQTVQLAWDAHKVRNRIAHEGSEYKLSERDAKRAYNLYEAVFRELKAIR